VRGLIKLALLVCLFLCCHSNKGQGKISGLSAGSNPLVIYDSAFINEYTMYNGRVYTPEKSSVLGHPFFESQDFQPALLKYRDLDLKCPLQYNIYAGQVLTHRNGVLIELSRENLKEFSFQNHRFVWVKEDQRNSLLDTDSFFELLYDGNIRFYSKRRKFIEEQVQGDYVKKVYVELDRYIIYRNGTLMPIKNKSSLLEVLSDKKKVLKEKIKSNRLDLKRKWEASVQQVCWYYDHAQ
jgi:hypothetical protein